MKYRKSSNKTVPVSHRNFPESSAHVLASPPGDLQMQRGDQKDKSTEKETDKKGVERAKRGEGEGGWSAGGRGGEGEGKYLERNSLSHLA